MIRNLHQSIVVVFSIFLGLSIPKNQTIQPTTSNFELLRYEFAFGISAIEWSPDSTQLAVGAAAITSILDIASGTIILEFEGEMDEAISLSWNPNGQSLAALGNRIILWDTTTGQSMDFLGFPDNLANSGTVSWNPDGSKLAFIHWEDKIGGQITQIWDSITGEVANIGHEMGSSLVKAEWSPNGDFIAISNGMTVGIWPVSGGEALVNFESIVGIDPVTRPIHVIAWRPDSDILAVAVGIPNLPNAPVEFPPAILLWDTQANEIVSEFEQHSDRISDISWSPNGTMFATGSEDGSVIARNVATRNTYTIIDDDPDGLLHAIDWSPDGTMLATESLHRTIIIWDIMALLEEQA